MFCFLEKYYLEGRIVIEKVYKNIDTITLNEFKKTNVR